MSDRRSRRRLGLLALVLGMAWAGLAGTAARADAYFVFIQPSVRGFGSVVGPGVNCANGNQLPGSLVACQQAFLSDGQLTTPGIFDFVAIPSGHWQFDGWESCQIPNGIVCRVVAPAGSFVVRPRFRDVTPPTVNSATPVFSAAVNSGVSFNVAGNEPLASATCSVGGRPAQPCNTPQFVPEGTHTVRVSGRDLSGNTSALSGSLTSIRMIDTRLTAGPGDFSNAKRPTFAYATGAGAGATFECSLDGAAFAACGASFTPPAALSEGVHTFRVRALDGPELDRTPLTRTWTVDSVAPNTTLDPLIGPRDGEVSTLFTASFAMSASEPATIQCRLDGAAFATCPATRAFSNLAFGQHSFQARAIDRAGNADATPVSRTWNILAVDSDGDGFNQRSDCNDADPLVRPGAREVAGNDVDENCDGFKAPPPRMTSTTVPNSWSVLGKRATITRLQIKRMRAGAKVEVRCLGKRCAFKRVKVQAKPKRGVLNVLRALKKKQRRLRAGQTLEIRITAPRVIGKVVRYKIRANKIPRAQELCLPPGTSKPAKCA